MNIYKKLEEKFTNREKLICTTMQFFNEPMLIEGMRRADLDFIIFDMEHGRFDTSQLVPYFNMCRVCGVPSIVRVPEICYHLIAKTIDMGADGIMLPRIESVEQVGQAIDAICFSPIGRKGFGGFGQWRPGESFEDFQKGRYLIPQIESPQGVENLPAILDIHGCHISAILVGPYDLSFMAGVPLDIEGTVVHDYIQKTYDICNEYRISVGIYCRNAKDAVECKRMGGNVYWIGTDKGIFMEAYNRLIGSLSEV